MHYDRVAPGQFEARRGHLVAGDIILHSDFLPGQALFLHPQQQDDVGPAQSLLDMARDAQPRRERGCNLRHELGRSAKRDRHANLGQQMAGAARYAAVEDVTDNRGVQALERFLVL